MSATRVLMVEDDTRLWRVTTALFEGCDVEVTFVATAAQALQHTDETAFDVALVDLGLPDLDGVQLITLLREKCPETPLIVLTVASSETRILAALRAGATGYLLKEDLGSRLVPGVLDALVGGAPLSPAAAKIVLGQLRGATSPEPHGPGLTAREREVIEGIARGLTYDDVAVALGISTNTVRTHIRSSYEKLGVATKAEAVALAMRRGLLS